METMDTEEEVLKDAIKSERSALQAELEAMKAERLAYAAELAQLRQERAALQAEKEQIRAEKEAMETERKALRLAEEITEKVKRRTGISYDVSKKGKGVLRGVKNGSGSRLFNQHKVLPKKRRSGTHSKSVGDVGSDNGNIEGDANWSQGRRTRTRRQTLHQPAVLLSTEEGLIMQRPITKTRGTRKRKTSTCSTGRNGNQQATVKKHTQPVQKKKVQLLELDDTDSEDEGGVTLPEAGEEDGAADCDNKVGKSAQSADCDNKVGKAAQSADCDNKVGKSAQSADCDNKVGKSAQSADCDNKVGKSAQSDDSDNKGEDLEGLEVRFDGAAILAALPGHISTNGDDGTDPNKAMQTRNIKWPRASRSRGKLPQVCKDCGRSFRLTSTYLSHIKTHTDGGSSHKRPGYKKTFRQLDQLTKHQNQHSRSAGQRHTCGHCLLTFSSVIRLRKHVHLSHKKSARGAKEFKCTKCKEVFTKASDLARHMGVHSEGKPFKCTHCKSSFNSPGNLTVHMKKHSGEKPFRCDECDATFPRSADLKSHVRKHSSVKPYTCQFCSAAFCRAGDLKPHMRTHTGEKPYQCEVCGAAFSTSSNLAVHRRTHTGERPFQCEQCGDSFSQLGHLTRHRSQHSTENSHHCTTCPASFGNAYHLKVHMQRHNTENTFKCKCGAAFSRASILTEHMRIHTGEKPYRCNQCPAAFARSANLAAHRRKHTGERPYVCPHCQQGFTQSTSLNRHLQSKKACVARHAASHSQLDGDDASTAVGENGATEGREEAVTFSTVGQEDVQSSSAVGVGDFFHGRGAHNEAQANHFLLPASTHVSTFDGGDSGGPVTQQTTEMNHASIFTITDAADNVSQASPTKGFNVAHCFSINENTQVIRNSMGAEQKFDYHENSQHSAMEQSLHGANSITHSMCSQAVTHQDSFHISQSSAYMAASKTILPEGDGVSNGAILQPQTSADVGNSASQHIVSSLAEANSRMVPLPPITMVTGAMVTDYQGGEGSSLVALRNLSHPSSYFHPHVSSPSISHLPQTHSQLPHQ